MSNDHGHHHDHEAPRPWEWSRRKFLGVAGAIGSAATLPGWLWVPKSASAAGSRSSLTGRAPIQTAMHVHGSWSEGAGSWHAQFEQASTSGIDVLYLTDHDYRAMGMFYGTSLQAATWVYAGTGSFAQRTATASNGSVRLVCESSSTTAGATATAQVDPSFTGYAFNHLRTSITGTLLTQKITSASLTNGAKYELVVALSYRPATNGRPAGQYQLVYRFGGPAGRWTEDAGLTGVVRAPTPAPGSSQVLDLTKDVAAIWPDMVAFDNCLYGIAFNAVSEGRGSVADIAVASVTIDRTRTSRSAIISDQAAIIAAYRSRYPTVKAHAQTEISASPTHLNTFGMDQWLPDYAALPTDHDTQYLEMVRQVHALGGIVSYNHPFGAEMGPLLSAADQDTKRRQVFASMNATNDFGVNILEVGYTVRGQVDAATHIALWDTFSRNGTWLTGNGVTDDHTGMNWSTLENGFATGIWAKKRSDGHLAKALRAGRAFTANISQYPNAHMDLLVDGVVPMGHISVGSKSSRQLTILAANVPTGCVVQLVQGPVDYAANVDPGTEVIRSFGPKPFANDVANVSVSTSSDCFYRVQVIDAAGDVVGTTNPVWLLRTAPPNGVPAARA